MDRQGKAWVISHHQTLSHCHTVTLSHCHTGTLSQPDWWQPRTCRTCRDLITQFIFIRTWPAVLPRNISQQASGDIRHHHHHHHHHLHHHHYHQLLQVLCLSRRKYVSDDDLSILSNVTMIEHQIGLRCFYWGVNISRNIIGRQDWGAGPGAPLLSSPLPLHHDAFPQFLILVKTGLVRWSHHTSSGQCLLLPLTWALQEAWTLGQHHWWLLDLILYLAPPSPLTSRSPPVTDDKAQA